MQHLADNFSSNVKSFCFRNAHMHLNVHFPASDSDKIIFLVLYFKLDAISYDAAVKPSDGSVKTE